MKSIFEFSGKAYKYDSLEDLSKTDQMSVLEAINALENSYAPYSQFNVGASVLLDNELYLKGANQENASFPLCVCAETSVLSQAGSVYPNNQIITLAVSSRPQNGRPLNAPAAPCGACRQIILEYESRQKSPIKILVHTNGQPIIEIPSIKILLPLNFNQEFLIDNS